MDRQIYRKCHQLHQLLHRHRQTVKMSSQRHCPQLRYVALFSIFTHNFAFPLKIIMFCLFDFFVCIFKLIPAHHFNFTHKHQTFYLMQTVLIEKKTHYWYMHKHLSNQKQTCTQNTNTHNVRLMGSQAFNNTQRPARNPEIAQNPSTNVQTPNSVAPSAGVFNRFGNADDDDDSSVDSAVAQSVAVCFALNSRN